MTITLTSVAPLPILQGGTASTTATGSGSVVLATSPTITTPNLGQPTSIDLTNATLLPLTTGVSGILPSANGGTGSNITFTQGSVIYSGASSQLSQDNSNFFWDAVHHRLGLGTTSPGKFLQITSSSQNNHIAITGTAPSYSLQDATPTEQGNIGLATSAAQYVSTSSTNDVIVRSIAGNVLFGFNTTEVGRFGVLGLTLPASLGILGVTSAGTASSGYVGETVSSLIPVGSQVTVANNTSTDITNLTLQPGDWDIFGNVYVGNSTALMSNALGWINTSSATEPDLSQTSFNVFPANNVSDWAGVVPSITHTSSTAFSVYLSVKSSFAAGPVHASGNLYARRRR